MNFFQDGNMAKEMAIVAISIMTLLMAGYAAYSVNELDTPTQTATAATIDYTEEFEIIQTKLNQVNQKLDQLESNTVEELQKIKSDLEQVIEFKTESAKPTLNPFTISLDRNIYTVGDEIIVSANGVLPQKSITVELQSMSGEIISKNLVYSDSQSRLSYSLTIPEFLSVGTYKVKATYNGEVDESSITVSANTVTPESTSSDEVSTSEPDLSAVASTEFNVSLDKESYKAGEVIRITGVGEPGESISLKMTDPNDKKTSAHSSVSNDGTYTMVYILDSNAETGNWQILITHGEDIESITIKVQN